MFRFPSGISMIFCIASCWLVMFVSVAGGLQAQPLNSDVDKNSGADLGGSMLQALLANNRSIENYDVTIKYESYSLSPDQDAKDFGSLYRVIQDRKVGGCVGAWSTRLDVWGSDQKKVKSQKRVVGYLKAVSGDAYKREVQRVQKYVPDSWDQVSGLIGWPSFRTIGLERFPNPSEDTEFWDKAAVSKSGVSSVVRADGNVVVNLKVENEGTDSVSYKWVFDPSTMLPRSVESSVISSTTKKQRPANRSLFEWEEVSGVYVPSSIHRTRIRYFKDKKTGNLLSFETYQDVEFVWKSVGGKIDEDVFAYENFVAMDLSKFLSIGEAEDN